MKKILVLFDIIAIIISYIFTTLLTQNNIKDCNVYETIAILAAVKIGLNFIFKLYHSQVTTGVYYFFKIGVSLILFGIVLRLLHYLNIINISTIATLNIMLTEGLFYLLTRYMNRVNQYLKYIHLKNCGNLTNILIIGNGIVGDLLLRDIAYNKETTFSVVGFVEDNLAKIGQKHRGIPIFGPVSNIADIAKSLKVKIVVFTFKTDKTFREKIVKELSDLNIKVKFTPSAMSILSGDKVNFLDEPKQSKKTIPEINHKMLLNREEISLNREEISNRIKGKVVLITGAGGSIGSELCAQIFTYKPKVMILFDISEQGVFFLDRELNKRIGLNGQDTKIRTIIGSVYNRPRIEFVFNRYRPEIVFHAAAYKHVPLMELNPIEAIRTNVYGTNNVIKMADKYETERFILVSTDKAVRPTNVMGATKKIAEDIMLYYSTFNKTKFSAVRFGNVLGSSGSVIPIFKKQIAEGGPVTVTHPDIIRYFMTIPEAVELILQTTEYSKGGEIFIFDMGEQVKIKNLAEQMIRLSGYEPYKDIDIKFTGLRPGEKLYEELLLDPTTQHTTENTQIFIEKSKELKDINATMEAIKQLIKEEAPSRKIKDTIATLVENYTMDMRHCND